MKAIIFGGSGQDGIYLNMLLNYLKIEVISVSRNNDILRGDVSDFDFVSNLIKTTIPSFIFHFAARSTTSHDAIFENNLAISSGSINILESVRIYSPKTKIFFSGSAMQFLNKNEPIDENTEFDPSSPYAISRIQSVLFARYYRKKYGLMVYIGYFFNHDSPFRASNHVNQYIVETAVKIAFGKAEKLIIGDLEVRKEFNFAGDIIKAVWLLVSQNEIFEAVIGSGKSFSIRSWIQYCFEQQNLNWENYVEINSKFVSDYSILVSNPSLIKSLGWNPEVDFFSLADMMLNSAKHKMM